MGGAFFYTYFSGVLKGIMLFTLKNIVCLLSQFI